MAFGLPASSGLALALLTHVLTLLVSSAGGVAALAHLGWSGRPGSGYGPGDHGRIFGAKAATIASAGGIVVPGTGEATGEDSNARSGDAVGATDA